VYLQSGRISGYVSLRGLVVWFRIRSRNSMPTGLFLRVGQES